MTAELAGAVGCLGGVRNASNWRTCQAEPRDPLGIRGVDDGLLVQFAGVYADLLCGGI